MPEEPVEIHLMVEDLHSRMDETQQEEFLAMIQKYRSDNDDGNDEKEEETNKEDDHDKKKPAKKATAKDKDVGKDTKVDEEAMAEKEGAGEKGGIEDVPVKAEQEDFNDEEVFI